MARQGKMARDARTQGIGMPMMMACRQGIIGIGMPSSACHRQLPSASASSASARHAIIGIIIGIGMPSPASAGQGIGKASACHRHAIIGSGKTQHSGAV